MTNTAAWGSTSADAAIGPISIDRRTIRAEDVDISIQYCGVCHSDLHTARNDWGRTNYPIVPGHEIVGIVNAIGSRVTRFQIGDRVAVGCLVDSCLSCEQCQANEEQYCKTGATGTYNGKDRQDGSPTFGGYSSRIVVREEFVLRVPAGMDMSRAAPLLCAGITTFSPLRHWKVGPGTKVAVVGLGGLGHMGVKLAVGMGAEVTMITTSPTKATDAKSLGAHHVLLSTDREASKLARGCFDFILDTIPVAHDLAPYLVLLKASGNLVVVGAIDMLPSFHSGLLLGGRKSIAGSAIGGIAETQEMLDFCASNNILPECELIRIDEINNAYERMEKSGVKYRFVIDMATL